MIGQNWVMIAYLSNTDQNQQKRSYIYKLGYI